MRVTPPDAVMRTRWEPAATHIVPTPARAMPWLSPPPPSPSITRLAWALALLDNAGSATTSPVSAPARGITDTVPCGVTRTTAVPAATHSAPSGPGAMPVARNAGTGNSVALPDGSRRPIRPAPAYHRAPSGPAVIASGVEPSGSRNRSTWPAVVILAAYSPPPSRTKNHTRPSGPDVMGKPACPEGSLKNEQREGLRSLLRPMS